MENPWFSGSALIHSYSLNELLGTKLRALYQRKKGRDLFDLCYALRSGVVEHKTIVECFMQYVKREGNLISSVLYILILQYNAMLF